MVMVPSFSEDNIFRASPFLKPHILFYNNSSDLAIRHGFPVITHIKVNSNHNSAILNFIEVKFLQGIFPLKPHILIYSRLMD